MRWHKLSMFIPWRSSLLLTNLMWIYKWLRGQQQPPPPPYSRLSPRPENPCGDLGLKTNRKRGSQNISCQSPLIRSSSWWSKHHHLIGIVFFIHAEDVDVLWGVTSGGGATVRTGRNTFFFTYSLILGSCFGLHCSCYINVTCRCTVANKM